MEASYFYVLVLPLGIFVFLLSAVAFHYARQEELARKRWMELVEASRESQPRQEETMNIELRGLEKLLQNGSIDQIVFERLKKALEDYYTTNVEPDRPEEEAVYNVT